MKPLTVKKLVGSIKMIIGSIKGKQQSSRGKRFLHTRYKTVLTRKIWTKCVDRHYLFDTMLNKSFTRKFYHCLLLTTEESFISFAATAEIEIKRTI